MTVKKVSLFLGLVLSLAGMTVQAQGVYAGASVDLTTLPVIAGVHVGGFVTERVGGRVGATTDFEGGALLDAEGLYAFADDGTWRGYAGGGASVVTNRFAFDGFSVFTLYGLVTTGAEYRAGRLGAFAELRGRFPHPWFGIFPELRGGVRYYF